ncbi:restriction endonuclease subunit S [Candidatus Poriferisocius sp.]|uniref:restriction endonuclease subunit S n=1 Tax=Candidatus Poriferisocius sp. TaxID=3101276 RepID=UPI003B015064
MTFQRVKLGEVATIDRRTVSPGEIQGQEQYVGLDNITSGGDFQRISTSGESGLKSNKFAFTGGHILYGKLRPYLAKIAAPDFEGICSTDILPIRPGPNLDRRYLLHYLRTPEMIASASSKTVGINLPRLSPKVLEVFQIPLPRVEEQRRIAGVLDAAEALRAKRHQALERLDSLTQAIFIEMFGDPVSNPWGWRDDRVLADVSEVRSGITKGRKTGSDTLTAVPYLAVANVQDGFIQLEPLKSIEATGAEISKYSLQIGDIVLTEGGDPDKLGRGAVWNGQVDPCIHQNHVFRVRLIDDSMTPEFLSRLLGSHRGKRYFLRMAKQTTGIASINMTQLRAFPLLEPPRAAQDEFLSRLLRIQEVEATIQHSRKQLDVLFASLQQRAFRGEL